MTTPPRICLGRIPQVVSLCDECLIKDVKQNEKDALHERELEHISYVKAMQKREMYALELEEITYQQTKERAASNNSRRVSSGDTDARRVSWGAVRKEDMERDW